MIEDEWMRYHQRWLCSTSTYNQNQQDLVTTVIDHEVHMPVLQWCTAIRTRQPSCRVIPYIQQSDLYQSG